MSYDLIEHAAMCAYLDWCEDPAAGDDECSAYVAGYNAAYNQQQEVINALRLEIISLLGEFQAGER